MTPWTPSQLGSDATLGPPPVTVAAGPTAMGTAPRLRALMANAANPAPPMITATTASTSWTPATPPPPLGATVPGGPNGPGAPPYPPGGTPNPPGGAPYPPAGTPKVGGALAVFDSPQAPQRTLPSDSMKGGSGAPHPEHLPVPWFIGGQATSVDPWATGSRRRCADRPGRTACRRAPPAGSRRAGGSPRHRRPSSG